MNFASLLGLEKLPSFRTQIFAFVWLWCALSQQWAHAVVSIGAGQTFFTANCTFGGCHTSGGVPGTTGPWPANLNGASPGGADISILQFVRSKGMFAATDAELQDLAAYFDSLVAGRAPTGVAVPYRAVGGPAVTTHIPLLDIRVKAAYDLNPAFTGMSFSGAATAQGTFTFDDTVNPTEILFIPNGGATAGTYAFTYTATGPSGRASTQRSGSITIAAASLPTFTTASVGMTAGVTYNGTLSATSTVAFTSFTAPSVPTGISINIGAVTNPSGTTYQAPFTATSTAPGVYTVGFRATNVDGATDANATFTVGTTAQACSASTPANTAVSIALAGCLFPGLSAPTGIAVTSPPQHGTVSIAGTNAVYTPANGYFGPDTFTTAGYYTGISAVSGTVTVSVTGRPDPSKDPTVVSLVKTQADAILRFSQAQVRNFASHLEWLRSSFGLGESSLGLASTSPTWKAPMGVGPPMVKPVLNAGAPSPGALYGPVSMLDSLEAARLAASKGPSALPVASLVGMTASELGIAGSPLFGLAANWAQNRSIDLSALSRSFGGSESTSGVGAGSQLWMEGVASFGSRDASGGLDGAEFSSSGITFGVDYPVSDKLVMGLGLGYAQDSTYIGSNGSRNLARGYSLAVYGNYQTSPHTYVSGLLGFGGYDFDSKRYVDPVADFALSNRKGVQVFGSVGAGYEYRDQRLLISPYGRIDFSSNRLNDASETGVGNYALTYFEQSSGASQAVVGIRTESVFSTPFGYSAPRARLEWRQDLQARSDATIAYADQVGSGPTYTIAQDGSKGSALVWGIGSDFIFRDGLTLGLDYQLSRVSAQESSVAIRIQLVKTLGVKGLPKALQGLDESFEDDNEITVDAGSTWDDNITRAKAASDIRGDTIYTVNVSKTHEFEIDRNSRFLLTGAAGGERFQNFNGLSKYTLTAEGTYQYRSGAEFTTPTWGLFAKLTGEDYNSTMRDGYRYSAGVSVLQPLTDRINLFGALAYNGRNASNKVFSTEESSMRLNVDYALSGGATLYMTGEYRDGDIVSTGLPSLENITIAKLPPVVDDAFAGGLFRSYQIKASTWLATIGYNLGLGARNALDISWRMVESTPALRPVWATSARSYITNQLSISYLMRF